MQIENEQAKPNAKKNVVQQKLGSKMNIIPKNTVAANTFINKKIKFAFSSWTLLLYCLVNIFWIYTKNMTINKNMYSIPFTAFYINSLFVQFVFILFSKKTIFFL